MNLADLEKRIRRLEISLLQRLATSDRRSVQQATNGVAHWVRKLEKLAMDANLIMVQAKARGDSRTALASIRVQCGILELEAKLRGDLDERSPTNINVTLDPQTAKRIAETYLERRKQLAGGEE
ncbi:MAG: hypothetical protein WBW60_18455 [Candidatus Sulfotelmatobacter sp.]